MYDVLVGKQRALIFPVMCNGHIKIDNAKNYATTPLGVWSHDDDFTFEFVLTPYDVNGYGRFGLDSVREDPSGTDVGQSSKKILPGFDVAPNAGTATNFQSQLYLKTYDTSSNEDRLNLKMALFHSSTLKIYLKNSTLHNDNNPARYKIEVAMTIDGSTETFTSDQVILPSYTQRFSYGTEPFTGDATKFSGFLENGKYEFTDVAHLTSNFTGGGTAMLVDSISDFWATSRANALEVFYRDGFNFHSLGTVASAAGSTLNLTSAFSSNLSSGTELYVRSYAEPTYINGFKHLAITYSKSNNSIGFYLNGTQVFSGNHSSTSSFAFPEEAYFIGANNNKSAGTNAAFANEQFMGELHEVALQKVVKRQFTSLGNLYPNFNDVLFYLRFEEVDE